MAIQFAGALIKLLVTWILLADVYVVRAYKEMQYEDMDEGFDPANYADLYGDDYGQYDDPFSFLPGQIDWEDDPDLVKLADDLISKVEKLISVLQSGDAWAYQSICSEEEVWHGDGLWNPSGFGSSCLEIIKSLDVLFARLKPSNIKVDPIAIVPNPHKRDVFLVGHFHMGNDNVLGVVRMVVDKNGNVAHTYFMSQATKDTAKAMLKEPEQAIRMRQALPKLEVLPYTGDDRTSHIIHMWVQLNNQWMMVAQDSLYGPDFMAAVSPRFRFISGLQVYPSDILPESAADFVEHMQQQHGQRDMEFVQISAAFSPSQHVAVQHVNYLMMDSNENMLKLSQGMEVAVFDTGDRLEQVWMFRQPFDFQERA